LDSLVFCAEDFDEVIIADDGSGKKTVAKIRDLIHNYDFSIRHIWQPKEGFRLAASRNKGIRAAMGDYLVFLDCDFVVLPGCIKSHVKAAKHGRFVAGFCKYLPEESTKQLIEEKISSDTLRKFYDSLSDRPIYREHLRYCKNSLLRKLNLVSPKKQICSSHFSVHKSDIESVNGYDENFVGWGGEDEDLALRLGLAGFHGYSIIHKAKAMHLWHPKELRGKDWRQGGNVAYLTRAEINYFCKNGLLKRAS
jgi:glycosyltransferase involved in cell wall biosynthesis